MTVYFIIKNLHTFCISAIKIIISELYVIVCIFLDPFSTITIYNSENGKKVWDH